MKRSFLLLFMCLTTYIWAQEPVRPVAKPLNTPKMQYFSLGDVQLTDSDYKYIQELPTFIYHARTGKTPPAAFSICAC